MLAVVKQKMVSVLPDPASGPLDGLPGGIEMIVPPVLQQKTFGHGTVVKVEIRSRLDLDGRILRTLEKECKKFLVVFEIFLATPITSPGSRNSGLKSRLNFSAIAAGFPQAFLRLLSSRILDSFVILFGQSPSSMQSSPANVFHKLCDFFILA